jgi:mTERF domain-containing protein
MQVIGPRHAFAVSKGLEAKLLTSGAACSSKTVRKHGGGFGWDLTSLVAGEDVEFADSLGASVNEYEGFRTAFEEEYTTKLSKDAAKEFQDELKKLGIYEGQ